MQKINEIFVVLINISKGFVTLFLNFRIIKAEFHSKSILMHLLHRFQFYLVNFFHFWVNRSLWSQIQVRNTLAFSQIFHCFLVHIQVHIWAEKVQENELTKSQLSHFLIQLSEFGIVQKIFLQSSCWNLESSSKSSKPVSKWLSLIFFHHTKLQSIL